MLTSYEHGAWPPHWEIERAGREAPVRCACSVPAQQHSTVVVARTPRARRPAGHPKAIDCEAWRAAQRFGPAACLQPHGACQPYAARPRRSTAIDRPDLSAGIGGHGLPEHSISMRPLEKEGRLSRRPDPGRPYGRLVLPLRFQVP